MIRARPKHPPGLGDRTLEILWHDAVLAHYGNRCINCGSGGELQAHHLVHRRCKVLKYDWRNGVPVHVGYCHEEVNRLGIRVAAAEEHWDYLRVMARATWKQYRFTLQLSDAEFRRRMRAELLRELARCEGGEANG